MRVIAGSAGGIPLRLPKTDLRPTMDMVRGAIFSSLADAVPGKRILDLFAGCGSLAIEALSRGAASAILVDSDRKACACIEQNLQKTRLTASVICSDVFRFLKTQLAINIADVIFADPPYAKKPGDTDYASELLRHESLPRMLQTDGILVLEVATAWRCPPLESWELIKRKRYGSTEVVYLRRTPTVLGLAPDRALEKKAESSPDTQIGHCLQEGA
jgi:16S rRNA (guanine966-N2)-methyltransferase